MNLQAIEGALIDDSFKGVPGGISPFPLREIGRQGWNVLRGDLPLPLALLKQQAIEHNSRWMQRFLELTGATIAPHGKTTMSPQLYQRQLEDGAWGITLATVSQVQLARRYGVARILLANQLVGNAAIDYVARQLEEDASFRFLCLVDSVEGVQALAERLRRHNLDRPMEVLLEVGLPGQRCGCRTAEAALEVARAVQRSAPTLELRGVEGFEGVVGGESIQEKEEGVSRFMNLLVEVARQCSSEHLVAQQGEVILSAGGSAFFDIVVDRLQQAGLARPTHVLIRSGCYLTHDSGMYQQLQERLLSRSPAARSLGEPPQAALEVWSYVQSRPEPQLAILTMGKRDCSFDVAMPRPMYWLRPGSHRLPQPIPPKHRIVRLNDQHAMADIPADSPLQVGDMVGCGISHPCTTFDRWQLIPIVDEEYNVLSAVRTFF